MDESWAMCFHGTMDAAVATGRDELWARLEALPCNIKGEIIDGVLHTQPRGRSRHMRVTGFLGHHLGGRFDYDNDGPGGWWILPEPGIELPNAREVSPDVAGWRHTTMPHLPPPRDPIRVVPDWVCEVLSPSNARYDLGVKLPFYARVGVRWVWHVDTRDHSIRVMELVQGVWVTRALCGTESRVSLPPFEVIEIPIGRMWIP